LSDISSNGAAKKEAPKEEEPAKPAEKAEEKTPEPISPKEEKKATAEPAAESTGRMIVSPIAARMAADNDIDLKTIKGSGPNGRIIKRDIEEALETGAKPAAAHSYIASQVVGAAAYRDENTSKMRQIIATRLAESIGPVPTFYLTIEVEMDNTFALRKQINGSIPEDQKISVNDIIVKAAAMASMRHPFVNSSYHDKTIRFYEQADVGVAVAIDEGLITPVVRGANLKGFGQISTEVKELAGRARAKKLQPEEYTGATFSISNLGMFGIKEFTAIINPPEAAILAVGGSNAMPVVRDGQIVVRNIMNVTMSCDHRVIDGATGAKFLQTFKEMLENPGMMLL
jgi:pyruvate dehydrogenase E2 component (dihydrolipoamide acetyltransferase)